MGQRKQADLEEVISTRVSRKIYKQALGEAKAAGVSRALWLRRLIETHFHLSAPRSKR